MKKKFEGFELAVEAGSFKDSQITVLLAENGSGKTSFVNLLAGLLKPDEVNGKRYDEKTNPVPTYGVSVKPQKIIPKFTGTVRELYHSKILSQYTNPLFVSDVIKPLGIQKLMDEKVLTLSGGQLQVVSIALCLGHPADIFLIDEPSVWLDSEQRLNAAQVIKRFIMHSRKSAFVVEHDILMSLYMADQVLTFTGEAAVSTIAKAPESLSTGMNAFLKGMDVTFRRDSETHRPRINKPNSVKHKEQKASGQYFFMDDEEEEDAEDQE